MGIQPFFYPRAKLARAIDLIDQLSPVLDAEALENPFMNGDFDAGKFFFGPNQILPLPTRSAAILGDIFHNMRSSLDIMACELVRFAGQSDAGVYFPFAESEAEFPAMVKKRKFHRAGDEAVALLATFQPYRGGNSALRGIHDLNILDKHRMMIPQAASVTVRSKIVTLPSGERRLAQDRSPVTFLFPQDSPFPGGALIPTTKELVEICDGIVEAFSALVAKQKGFG